MSTPYARLERAQQAPGYREAAAAEKRTAAVSSPYARLERAQQARDRREDAAAEKGQLRRAAPTRGSKRREAAGRRPLRQKDRSREEPPCEARAGPTSTRLQEGGRCGKRTAAVSSPYARLERAQQARDCREEAAAEKGPLP